MCFDTTASNSGVKKGASKLLEEELGRKLLWLACRHHILELIIGAVWEKLFGEVKGPDNPYFKALRKEWQSIDHTDHLEMSLDVDEPDHHWLMELKERTLAELHTVLSRPSEFLPRGDYRELAELTMVVLGATPPRESFQFSYPGAVHQARWMAVVLYALKMFIFQDQMGYDEETREKLLRMTMFTSLLYSSAWLTCTKAADAPANDLRLYQDLLKFKEYDPEIAEVALNKLSNHKWYLSQELVVLAALSENTHEDDKSHIAAAILSHTKPLTYTLGRPQFPPVITSASSLSDFIGPQSYVMLDLLDMGVEWLYSPPSEWDTFDCYVRAKAIINSVKVTNDVAERHIKTISDYSTKITADGEQRQCLLQVVEQQRRRYPSFKKKVLFK